MHLENQKSICEPDALLWREQIKDPRIIKVGRDLKAHFIPNPCPGQEHLALDQLAPIKDATLERSQNSFKDLFCTHL